MLVVPTKKMLVIASNAKEKILSAIPHSKAFKLEGRDMVAVPHGVEEALVLRNIGFKKGELQLCPYSEPISLS